MATSTSGLKAILKRNGIKQGHIARVMSVTPFTLSNWAKCRRVPNAGNLARLLAALRKYEPELTPEDLSSPDGRAA